MSKCRFDDLEKKKPSPVGGTTAFDNAQNASHDETSVSHSTKKSSTKDGRYRYWTIVVYPESAPEDWRDRLTGLQWVESPLHDKDTNPDGSVKKTHWHIIIFNQGKLSYNQAKKIADSINGASPQYVQNITGMVRYLAHIDNPEKAQYDKSKIIGHGIDVSKYLESENDIDELMREIEMFIRKNKITEYGDLVDISSDLHEDYPDWHKCVTTHTIHFRGYLASKRHKLLLTEKELEEKEKKDTDDLALEALTNQE